MRRASILSALAVNAGFATFWADTIVDTLLREFSANVTFVDLAVLLVLGFIARLAAGLILALGRQQATAAR